MPTLNIFVSFEFDKDQDLKNNFLRQAKEETNHRIRDCSLHESYGKYVGKLTIAGSIKAMKKRRATTISLFDLMTRYPTQQHAIDYLEHVRWARSRAAHAATIRR